MRLARLCRGDAGSAALEFVAGALVLLVPCVYAVLSFGAIEAASFAVEGAARHAARLYVDLPEAGLAGNVAREAVRQTMTEVAGVVGRPTVRISCRPACLAPGGWVTVRVSARVGLPFLPRWPAIRRVTSVMVSADATQSTGRFGAKPA